MSNKKLMIDYQTITENIKVMRECRDAIGNTPELEELLFVDHLSEDNKTLIKSICDELSNAYTVLDVCSYGIDVLTKADTPKHETVEEWEKRTGESYPDDAPVWAWIQGDDFHSDDWELMEYQWGKINVDFPTEQIIVANNNGKPAEE